MSLREAQAQHAVVLRMATLCSRQRNSKSNMPRAWEVWHGGAFLSGRRRSSGAPASCRRPPGGHWAG
eukprot:9073466-Alexandrium_andersonii.AAC.1